MTVFYFEKAFPLTDAIENSAPSIDGIAISSRVSPTLISMDI